MNRLRKRNLRQYLGVLNVEVHLETKHGSSPLLAASVSNRPYDHADALKFLPEKD